MARFQVLFKKNGRPTKAEIALMDDINPMLKQIEKSGNKKAIGILSKKLRCISIDQLEALKTDVAQELNPVKRVAQKKNVSSKQEVSPSQNQQQSGTNEPIVTSEEIETETEIETEETIEGEQQTGSGEETIINEPLKSDFADQFEDTPIEDWNPLNRHVIKKDYAGKNVLSQGSQVEKKQEPTNQNTQNTSAVSKPMKDIPTLEDRIKAEQAKTGSTIPPVTDNKTTTQQPTTTTTPPASSTTAPITSKTPMKDMPPAQKQKYAEKTADAILNSYGKFVRGKFNPLKSWSLIDMDKVKQLAMANKLNLDMKLKLGNNTKVTTMQYLLDRNYQVESTFVLTPEARRDIREPLIEVIIENNLQLSATQRLIIAVGEHAVGMIRSAYVFYNQNKVDMAAFEKYHKEQLTAIKETGKTIEENETTVPPVMDSTENIKKEEQTKEGAKVNTEQNENKATSVSDFLAEQAAKKSSVSNSGNKKTNKNGRRK